MFAPGSSRPLRFGGLIAVCAFAALLVAMAAPSRADATRAQCTGVPSAGWGSGVSRSGALPEGIQMSATTKAIAIATAMP